MPTQRHAILSRHKDHDLYLSRPADLELGPGAPFDAAAIAGDPRLSLYCLDFRRRRALFAETGPEVDLAQSPFLFVAQFRHARAIVSAPFEALRPIAEAAPLDPARLVFLHSVGRCGSTLVRNVLATQPGICSLSEPDAFTQIADALGGGEITLAEARELAELCVRLYAKPIAGAEGARWTSLKFRSQCIQISELLANAFPDARTLYITREPLGWLESAYRAFVDPDLAESADYRQRFEDVFARMMPLVREQRIPGEPMRLAKLWLLNWISNEEALERLRASGAAVLEIDFSEIDSDPEGAMRRVFAYCDFNDIDWAAARRALASDSQAGTAVARDAIGDQRRKLPHAEREEAAAFLDRWRRGRAGR